MKCSKCGLENKPESKICESCGSKLKKGNVAVIITIIVVVCLCTYLMAINVFSIIEYGEPAGFFPKIIKNNVDYSKYEFKVKEAAKKYFDDNKYELGSIKKNSNVILDDLYSYGLSDYSVLSDCKGYALVEADDDIHSYISCEKYKSYDYNKKYEKETKISYKDNKKYVLKYEDFLNGSILDYSEKIKQLNNDFKISLKKKDNDIYSSYYSIKVNDVDISEDSTLDAYVSKNRTQLEFYTIGDTLVYHSVYQKKILFINSKAEIINNFSIEDAVLNEGTKKYEISSDNLGIKIKASILEKTEDNSSIVMNIGNAKAKGFDYNGVELFGPAMFYKENSNKPSWKVKLTLDEFTKLLNISSNAHVEEVYSYSLKNNHLDIHPTKESISLEKYYNEKVSEKYDLYLSGQEY